MKREEWIDLARSIVMIMVIFGHIGTYLTSKGFSGNQMRIFFMTTSAIKIPGFFAISGYLFSDRDGKGVNFLKHKILKIAVPYFCLGLISMLLNIGIYIYHIGVVNTDVEIYIINYFKNYILGKNLWFIPCLFIVEIIFFLIKKICKSNLWMMGISSLFVCGVGLLWSSPKVMLPWRLDTACICTFFLYCGYFLRNCDRIKEIVLSKKGVLITGISYFLLVFISYYMYGWKNMDVNQNSYYNIFLCIFMVLFGVAFLFSIMKVLGKSKLLSFVGQNTLTYFAFHLFFAKLIYKLLRAFFIIRFKNEILIYTAIVCIITLIVMVPLICFINRFMPFIVGKSYRK